MCNNIENETVGISKALESSKQMLEMLNKAAIAFVSQSEESFEKRIEDGVRAICDMAKLDRFCIFRNLAMPDCLHVLQEYRWDRETGGTIEIDPVLKDVTYAKLAPRWETILANNEIVNGPVKTMPESAMLKSFGLVSALVVPLFIKNSFWGFALFEDRYNERYFDKEQVEMMRSAAFLCANVFIQWQTEIEIDKTTKALESSKQMLEMLNKAAITFVSQSEESYEKRIEAGVRSICDMAKLDRFSVFQNFPMPDAMHVSQIYRWDRQAGGSTEIFHEILKYTTYAKLMPKWENILSNNEILNGPSKLMPESKALQLFGVVSALVVPLFFKNTFWGFVLFEDRHNERYFDEVQVEMMRSAAFLCVNTLIQRQMELEVVESNELNNSMLNAVPVTIVILSENGEVLNCNDAATKMFKCTKQQFMENFYDLSPEYQPDGSKSKERAKELASYIFTGNPNLSFEWIHTSFSGDIIPCEITTTWVSHKGKHLGLVYIYDLRNIKKIEAAVTEAQEMTRAITEANPMSYVLFDENYQPIDCNEAIVKMLGSKNKQHLLDNYFTLFCPERQSYDNKNSEEEAKILLNKTVKEGKCTYEWDMQSSSGEVIPVENTLTLLELKNKKFIISYKYDLRNRKTLLNSIRKQSDLLASKLELQKAITEISENFILYEDINKSIDLALEKLGENLNVSRMVVFHVDYENKNVCAVNQWYANDNVPMVKIERFDNFTTDNLLFPVELDENSQRLMVSCSNTASEPKFSTLESMGITSFIYAPLYVEGSLWGVVCAENCLLTHEWTEDERTFFATVSNIMSGAIMRNVYSTRLQQSLDKVVALSKSKDDFLSKISHEIRTPMNAILGITEIQLQNETASQKKEALGIIHNSGKSLLHIVNDLLDLSKIEAKKMEIIPVKYDVASLINDTVQLYAARIEKKLIKFNLKVDENIPAELLGDELRIKQILNNILSNAFKYTDDGEISMSITSEKIKDKDSDIMMVFRISDTGQGMTEEQKSRIFDEYYRFNLINNRMVGGTGLGMTIVQNLIIIMGGNISIESELNKGSAFTISLPQKIVNTHILGKTVAENLQNFQTGSFLQARKPNITRKSMSYGSVLVVDDLESNLYVARNFLEPYELSIETAISGFEAIDKVKSGKVYDIIFMDHMMPKMDGIEAVKIIRSTGYKHPIVALTANAIVGQAEIFLENGFDAFISKPIDAKQLDAELNKFIYDEQMQKQAKKRELPKINATLLSFFIKDTKNALPILESTLANIETISEEDFQLYAVTAHGVKSALANIGQTELSQIAYALEKAGKAQDKNIIKQQTQELVDALKEFIEGDLCK
ncbi:MAG: GAF domain-containing protein [Fibromonadaceae bacterium]|jgi:signal transduction histidine kinase/DNA-binding response OmpR family regulator/PAS domain-containing protein|nr:GAF domain-containing protein [Fibromonadaceae bacterium]